MKVLSRITDTVDLNLDGAMEDRDKNSGMNVSQNNQSEPNSLPAEPIISNKEEKPNQSSNRLLSLDAFRGLTILGMLLVNNIALDYATPKQLMHAAWNQGTNFADLVFPWFLLIVGVAIPYSFASHKNKGQPAWKYLLKAISRATILVLLGCFIESSIVKQPVFGLGVLQLIGLAYLVAAVLYQLPAALRAVAIGAFLLTHWAAIRFIPVPGGGIGVFTEAQNLINYVNGTHLQQYHLSGLVSVIPTSALVLIGAFIGDFLRNKALSPEKKAMYMFAGGVLLALAGWIWNLDLPFNKPVWTSSYILYTAGLGCAVLSMLYMLIDVKGRKWWTFPLIVFGSNAIAAYIVPIIVKVYILQVWVINTSDGSAISLQQAALHSLVAKLGTVPGGWIYTISYILCCWLLMLYLYRKKIFLRV